MNLNLGLNSILICIVTTGESTNRPLGVSVHFYAITGFTKSENKVCVYVHIVYSSHNNYVESNALNNWKLNILQIFDKRISFYLNNLDLLPPKPKFSFRHLKQSIQEFHRKYVLVPADKAANNVVVVWRLHYISTLIQELGSTKTYERTPTDEKSLVDNHCCLIYY